MFANQKVGKYKGFDIFLVSFPPVSWVPDGGFMNVVSLFWFFVTLNILSLPNSISFHILFYFGLIWQHGSVYKLAFGPKAFVVVSDPIVARHILRENIFGYDKVLSNNVLLFAVPFFSPLLTEDIA